MRNPSQSPIKMTIDCDLTPEDIVASNLYHWKNTPALRRRRLLVVCILSSILPLLAAFGLYSEIKNSSSLADAVVLCIPVLILSAAMPFCLRWSFRMKIRNAVRLALGRGKKQEITGPRHFIITDNDLTQITPFSKKTTAWGGIEKIASDGEYIFVYDSTMAYVIPRRSITNGADFDGAWKMIQDCHARHSAIADK
ncbi:MAG: YcxB family protein [Opitutaceae bacterium]|jgi:hypothetical protein|nr:YcxB family protein [Opitutaceae bacterium]